MTWTFSTGLRNANRDAMDAFNGGVLEIRTGAPPGPNLAESGTLLASITLPADAFTATDGALALAGTWQDASADATGTAGHFRMRASGDAGGASTSALRHEGTITASGGGGDMIADNTSISAGQSVSVTTFGITFPAS